jgi:phosphatidylglycerophosphatase A
LLLFRLFDITKPFPVRRFERLPAGWGIVLDDVAAGLYALCVASVLRIWI